MRRLLVIVIFHISHTRARGQGSAGATGAQYATKVVTGRTSSDVFHNSTDRASTGEEMMSHPKTKYGDSDR